MNFILYNMYFKVKRKSIYLYNSEIGGSNPTDPA